MKVIYVFNELSAPMADRIPVCAETLDDARDYLEGVTENHRDIPLVHQYTPIGISPEMGVMR